ncbi:formate--tetrahydrofolate ligase family protein, partial [Vibrio parahaemolyticus V-223/04]
CLKNLIHMENTKPKYTLSV